MKVRWLAIAAGMLGLACKGKPAPAPPVRDDAGPLVPADAAPIDAAVDAPPDASPATTITGDGVGPITRKTASEEAFQRLFPGHRVTAEHHEAEDYAYDEILVGKPDQVTLRAVITDDRLFKVEVKDATFATATGVAVGMTAGELAARLPDVACVHESYDPEADAERVERALRCEAPSLPNVTFDLDLAGFSRGEGKVPIKAIAKRKIIQIVWLPTRG
jgi:hypothetical protein